ncbi:MAG: Glycine cleavage system H protein [Firmicutes bacterium]|nr:Glycine cleavage system H protein [candidate division NPL-UPA2 bacterium]MBT9154356.1 Glycine cleavage system H protein [candidate division NPL-UPA2 bacterium]
MNVPQQLVYSREHEWVKIDGDRATIGITDYAQGSLGDIVFVELPAEGDKVKAGVGFGVVESVKAASDLYCPISGTVVAANHALLDNPELLNTDPYTNWIIAVAISDHGELATLLTPEQYAELIK